MKYVAYTIFATLKIVSFIIKILASTAYYLAEATDEWEYFKRRSSSASIKTFIWLNRQRIQLVKFGHRYDPIIKEWWDRSVTFRRELCEECGTARITRVF